MGPLQSDTMRVLGSRFLVDQMIYEGEEDDGAGIFD